MEGEVFLDPIEFLRELDRRRLPYLLVGRQAPPRQAIITECQNRGTIPVL